MVDLRDCDLLRHFAKRKADTIYRSDDATHAVRYTFLKSDLSP